MRESDWFRCLGTTAAFAVATQMARDRRVENLVTDTIMAGVSKQMLAKVLHSLQNKIQRTRYE